MIHLEMEPLIPHLSRVGIPEPHHPVYKDECVFSFDTPESEGGLYISLSTFHGMGAEHVEEYAERTSYYLFLHVKRERKEVPSSCQGDGPEKKITRLAIGVEGGFDPDAAAKKYEFTDHYEVVMLPKYKKFPWPDEKFPYIVKESVRRIIAMDSAHKRQELLELTSSAWDGEARVVSKFAEGLLQLDNGAKIPPSAWKCEKCDKTDNLWLNLTDGTVLCGRKFHDGSGGNNHAIEHYAETRYPLAVKLGTITKEGKGDVFSYAEDDMVEDPGLIEHLAHWGINITSMEKTDKSMAELELELNKRSNEWAALQETGGKLQPVYGPGYTGMENLGNSCYLNSVVQMLFVVPDIVREFTGRVYSQMVSADFGDPANDLDAQMLKLGTALTSGKFSQPPATSADPEPPGISPHMFKSMVGRGHPDFSTKKQQDAQEFFVHLMTLMETQLDAPDNPGKCFKFQVQERIQCSASKKVKYTHRSEYVLSLNIPLEAAFNKEEVAAYESTKKEVEAQNKRMDPNWVVRPRIKVFSCLEAFGQMELVEQFYSTAIEAKTTARKTTRLSTFPKFLVVQLKKFTLREDWVPIKLDVAVEMPDELDLSMLAASGPQPDEEPLPDLVHTPPDPEISQHIMDGLLDMGFPKEACKRAIFFSRNTDIESAVGWIMEHLTDANFASPFVPPGTEDEPQFQYDQEMLEGLSAMGFVESQAKKALMVGENNMDRAMDWLFNRAHNSGRAPSPTFSNGEPYYRLMGFVSHMGTSTMVGHYVVHLLKEGRWVIFNDNKVTFSERPPKDLGYLYLYERCARSYDKY